MRDAQLEVDRPSALLRGPGIAIAVRRAFLATRPPFLIASVLPVLVGTAWASAAYHRFDALLFGLALAATMLVHAAANVYNDVGDDVIGADAGNTDHIYPYTGGSRFIQEGLLSRREMTRLALVLFGAALLIGTCLAVLRGSGVILLGLAGLALGLLYSMPGAQLSARGVGELAVALAFGVLPVLGAAWLQTGTIDSSAVLLCIPVSCWVTTILIINEVPDIEADRRAGKRTLAVRWGPAGARVLYRGLTVLALGAAGLAMARDALPLWFAVPAVALAALGWTAAGRISIERASRRRLRQGIELTLAIQALGCVALIVALLVERFA